MIVRIEFKNLFERDIFLLYIYIYTHKFTSATVFQDPASVRNDIHDALHKVHNKLFDRSRRKSFISI